jgi:hypothetical protein
MSELKLRPPKKQFLGWQISNLQSAPSLALTRTPPRLHASGGNKEH